MNSDKATFSDSRDSSSILQISLCRCLAAELVRFELPVHFIVFVGVSGPKKTASNGPGDMVPRQFNLLRWLLGVLRKEKQFSFIYSVRFCCKIPFRKLVAHAAEV